MGRLVNGVLLLSLVAAPGLASALFFEGTFTADNQIALSNIPPDTSETITIHTDSYAGGTLDAIPVAAGGFAPSAFLFDVGQDAAAGNCDDINFPNNLGQGTFTLALAVYNNNPADTGVADGLVENWDSGVSRQEAFPFTI